MRKCILLWALFSLVSCTSLDDVLKKKAQRLAQEILIIDTHIDVPYRLWNQPDDISIHTESGNFDYPRAVAGGLNAPFMAIFVYSGYEGEGGPKVLADSLIDMMERIASESPDKFSMAQSIEDIKQNFIDGKISFLLGIENGAAIDDDITNIEHFYKRGIRYITLTHIKDNKICDSSFDTTRMWRGLSSFGREVVLEMNRLGCMIDVSHVSDDAFYQIIELSKAPVIASHSSCRFFTPTWERNMSDDMIRKLAAKGGMVNINFGSMFLLDECRKQTEIARKEITAHLDTNNIEWGSKEARAYAKKYHEEHPLSYGTVADLANHIDHVVEIAGVDHVGFGSDFDGVGDILPEGLKDVSCYPDIIYELLKRGYSEDDVEKICSGNLLRVFGEVEKVARKLNK